MSSGIAADRREQPGMRRCRVSSDGAFSPFGLGIGVLPFTHTVDDTPPLYSHHWPLQLHQYMLPPKHARRLRTGRRRHTCRRDAKEMPPIGVRCPIDWSSRAMGGDYDSSRRGRRLAPAELITSLLASLSRGGHEAAGFDLLFRYCEV